MEYEEPKPKKKKIKATKNNNKMLDWARESLAGSTDLQYVAILGWFTASHIVS